MRNEKFSYDSICDEASHGDAFARAILSAFESKVIAEGVLKRLKATVEANFAPAEEEWMDTKRAAEYLGISVGALHKHTAARTVPCHQDVPRGKCWFLPSELDRWRRHEGRTRFHGASTDRRKFG